MRILFAVKALNGIAGGAERVLCVIASRLAERGHDVAIASFDHLQAPPFYDLSPKVRREFLGREDPRRSSGPGDVAARTVSLRAFVKKEKPDIAIGFMHSIFVPLAFSLIGTGIPVIASEHIVPRYYKSRPYQYAVVIAASLLAKKTTVLSEPVRALYPKILHKKMAVIPNPVVSRPAGAAAEKKKIVLSVGRLDPQKDQATLIEAFALLSPGLPGWSLRIVGEGELKPELDRLVRKLGLGDKVSLPGKTAHIEEEYRSAEIFALPSLYESFGLATAEALSFGLPAVGFSDCPGTNEIIVDGYNGFLAKPGDRVSSLAAALKRLMKSEDLRRELGARGPESVAKYDPDTVASLWEDLIRQAL